MSGTVEERVTAETTAPPLAGIQHVGITVTDVEASEAWYGRVLGMRRFFVEPHYGGDGTGYVVVLGAPGVPLNLGLEHHPTNRGEPFDPVRTGMDHVCFLVDSRETLDAWTTHLDRLGMAHSDVVQFEAAGMSFSLFNFRDPDGIVLELMAVRPA